PRKTTVRKKFTVKLSKVNAWKSFRLIWWVGLGSSILLAAASGWWLARLASHMKWDSPPDLVEPLDTPPLDLPPDELEREREQARARQADEDERGRRDRPWERE
ncbi:MAG: hypothetical protein K2V38_25440, partial [Gemmataceae bacterium]|nr:hypothetical protein [Gemmataceae bacterium]